VCLQQNFFFEREKPVDPKIAYRQDNTYTHTLSVCIESGEKTPPLPSFFLLFVSCRIYFSQKEVERGGMMFL
jgi:hypothetical protein